MPLGMSMKMTEIVAEIACSHDGDYEKVIRMIRIARECYIDAIQLQVFTKKNKHLQFTLVQWDEIIREIRKDSKLKLYLTPYDRGALRIAETCRPDGYKIHGCMYDKEVLIDAIVDKGKPIHLMVGGKTMSEIKRMVKKMRKIDLTLLYGIQLFPTPINATNLDFLTVLSNKFPHAKIGLADHIDAYSVMAKIIPIMALCYGVDVIEKHIRLMKTKCDREAGLLPADFREFVEWERMAEYALGSRSTLSNAEKRYRKYCDLAK